MALFVKQSEDRTELQQRLAAELREKAKQRAAREDDRPDGIEDSEFLRNTKRTTSLAWVWVLIVLFILVAIVYFALKSTSA
jgi:hypothetical protein